MLPLPAIGGEISLVEVVAVSIQIGVDRDGTIDSHVQLIQSPHVPVFSSAAK
jgi:hypothetical protein